MSGRLSSAEITKDTEREMMQWLHDNRCTDGLPVVLPTRAYVEEMLQNANFAGFDSDLILGEIGPGMGEATVEKVAVSAVMAGCSPEHFPVVIAAVRAICDIRMDMTEVQATTHDLTPLLIVNGPVRQEVALSGSYGALGYGHRANVTIGRAVRLCLINIGQGWPGISDMALIGHPGKLTYCLAEDEDESPFPPLHASLGFSADQSVVTVTCVGAPHSVLALTNADDPDSAERILELLARTIRTPGNNSSTAGKGTIVVCLNPDHARVLFDAGYDRRAIQQRLCELATNPTTLIQRLRFGSLAPEDTDPDARIGAVGSPESVLVLVAGGPGVYSTVMTPWSAGPHGNPYVSVEVVSVDDCEIPLTP